MDLSTKCLSASTISPVNMEADNPALRLVYVEGRLRVLEDAAARRWTFLGVVAERVPDDVPEQPTVVCGCGRKFFKGRALAAHKRWSANIKCFAGQSSDELHREGMRGDLRRRS